MRFQIREKYSFHKIESTFKNNGFNCKTKVQVIALKERSRPLPGQQLGVRASDSPLSTRPVITTDITSFINESSVQTFTFENS